jgi:3-oxoacyl-[acyl-carrier protein] reductase
MLDKGRLEDEGALGNQVALVLGGTGLVGREVCRALAAQGVSVAVHHRAGAGVAGTGVEVLVDASCAGAGAEAVKLTTQLLGPPVIVVNSFHPHFEPVAIEAMAYERDWGTHLASLRFYVEAVTAALPGMRAARFGRFVLVSGAISARPLPGCAAYGTVKAGLHSFQRHLALEEGTYGVTANTIAPGRVAPAVPVPSSSGWKAANASGPRPALPGEGPEAAEVAALAAFLCRPEAKGITGQVVYMAQGQVMP